MTDYLTEDERAEVLDELQRCRASEYELKAVESVSPEASVRRTETLKRLQGEIARMERLLRMPPSPGASEATP